MTETTDGNRQTDRSFGELEVVHAFTEGPMPTGVSVSHTGQGRPFLAQESPDAQPQAVAMGSDGIAISADGARLWICPPAARPWYSVATDALVDRDLDHGAVAATVVDEGDQGSAGDGLETDDAGNLYAAAGEQNAVLRRRPDGTMETVLHDPRLLWPDTMSVAADGRRYVTADQLHRQAPYAGGVDQRQYPYLLLRTLIAAAPARLTR